MCHISSYKILISKINIKLFVGDKQTDTVDDSVSHRHDAMAVHKLELDMAPSAIAGLLEPEAERFEDHRDPRIKCSPVSQCWTPAGDILVGCEQGQLLRFDGESKQLKVVFCPQHA
ncbi:CFAP43 [Bugula neritina]|uniref:CFAP43 n=1 Tax=Bugula neritina TaxID=10212 RepID=A0A7J7JD71_BUGNE|nr:CFAP43 [Bugula neritina]